MSVEAEGVGPRGRGAAREGEGVTEERWPRPRRYPMAGVTEGRWPRPRRYPMALNFGGVGSVIGASTCRVLVSAARTLNRHRVMLGELPRPWEQCRAAPVPRQGGKSGPKSIGPPSIPRFRPTKHVFCSKSNTCFALARRPRIHTRLRRSGLQVRHEVEIDLPGGGIPCTLFLSTRIPWYSRV